MAFNIYQASVPVFQRRLTAVIAFIEKAAAHTEAKRIDPSALLGARLFPDMFPFTRQVQTATDHAKGATARLAGLEVPRFPDTESTFDELKDRVGKTLEFIDSVEPSLLDGAEDRDVTLMLGGKERTMKGAFYLLNSAMPNFYFHVTTAYDILRHNGVELGKSDFLGTGTRQRT
jgi:hypothetical protein